MAEQPGEGQLEQGVAVAGGEGLERLQTVEGPLREQAVLSLGRELMTTRATEPVWRASTKAPPIWYDDNTRGWPARSTRSSNGPEAD